MNTEMITKRGIESALYVCPAPVAASADQEIARDQPPNRRRRPTGSGAFCCPSGPPSRPFVQPSVNSGEKTLCRPDRVL